MRVLVRHIARRSRDGASYQEQLLSGARLGLGRGTDQDILLPNLRVTLAHAELVEGTDGRIRLQSPLTSGFHHNGSITQSAVLATGDVIAIGPYRLTVGTQADVDLVLEVVDDSAGRGNELEQSLYARARLGIAASGLSKRPLALGLGAAILLLLLIVPLVGALYLPAADWLRNLPLLPSDHAWSSGPVSNAHAHFADQCERCHSAPFRPVANAECEHCHVNQPAHVGKDLLVQGLFAGARCADCHHEHNAGVSIARQDEALCVSCHADLKAVHAQTTLADARHFGDDHPPFRPAVLTKLLTGTAPAGAGEAPGVEFPHDLHLREKGFVQTDGSRRRLACADCHQPEPGGELMAPVRFEQHCASCHQLLITGDEARAVPHGDVRAALQAISDYYAGQALRGGYPNDFAPDVVQFRRRPGVALTAAERQDALSWAEDMARMTGQEMIAYTTCGTCHQAEATGEPGVAAWRLAPVRIPRHWLPKARFDHAQHDAMRCADCHGDVARSQTSADVMLPDIDSCRSCHGGADAHAGRLASTCVTCHDFHRAHAADAELTATPEP